MSYFLEKHICFSKIFNFLDNSLEVENLCPLRLTFSIFWDSFLHWLLKASILVVVITDCLGFFLPSGTFSFPLPYFLIGIPPLSCHRWQLRLSLCQLHWRPRPWVCVRLMICVFSSVLFWQKKVDPSKAGTLEAAAKPEPPPPVQEEKKLTSKSSFMSLFKPKVRTDSLQISPVPLKIVEYL